MLDAPPGRLAEERAQQRARPVPIFNVGGQHQHQHQHQQKQPYGVPQDRPLAPGDFLAGVATSLVAAFGALDALAVEDGRTGLAVAPCHDPHLFAQMRMNLDP